MHRHACVRGLSSLAGFLEETRQAAQTTVSASWYSMRSDLRGLTRTGERAKLAVGGLVIAAVKYAGEIADKPIPTHRAALRHIASSMQAGIFFLSEPRESPRMLSRCLVLWS